jgi:hypothetical protein
MEGRILLVLVLLILSLTGLAILAALLYWLLRQDRRQQAEAPTAGEEWQELEIGEETITEEANSETIEIAEMSNHV